MIGTVDSIHAIDTAYGQHRKLLEDFIKAHYKDYYIFRLCSLIHKDIQKNVLYDLTHNLYLDKINRLQYNQWYVLSRLRLDITRMIKDNIREANFVSEPISNEEIINKFYPNFNFGYDKETKPYNLSCNCNLPTNYLLTKKNIFKEIENYVNIQSR